MDTGMFDVLPYIPGVGIKHPEPLSRYLPPVPDGIISTWLSANIPPGSWILDPFCASPRLAVEAARAGYRLLVTANNPIGRFLLEMAANPPRVEDLRSALAELAASYKADERIEPHIRSLYNTQCARCGQIIPADAFLWEHGSSSPYIRIYTCPSCGDTGEHPCTAFDIEHTSKHSGSGLHRARAIERIVAANDPDRIHVEQALSVYLPRSIYALVTIINKLDALEVSSANHTILEALLLHAFDQSNSLWRVPGPQGRRRQLLIPHRFRENNVWLAMESGIEIWSARDEEGITKSIPVTTWPNLPPESGGICIYEGRLASIANSVKTLLIRAVCAAVPRPNQAFWTLSALWAGWLWGRDPASTFKNVLRRQRYDWGWHTTALSSVFKQLVTALDPFTPILGLFGEAEPGFIVSALLAASSAGCSLDGIAIRDEQDQAQVLWKCQNKPKQYQSVMKLAETGISTAKRYLEDRGEPSSYLNTISAEVMSIVQLADGENPKQIENQLPGGKSSSIVDGSDEQNEINPSATYSMVYNTAREVLSYRSGFLRFNLQSSSGEEPSALKITNPPQNRQETFFANNTERSEDEDDLSVSESSSLEEDQSEKERPTRSSDVSESSLIWLREPENAKRLSTTDLCELTLVNYLATHPGCTFEHVDNEMCRRFPGLFTPDLDFIQTCLESYGEKEDATGNSWQLRREDSPNERRNDVEKAFQYIHTIAKKLGLPSSNQPGEKNKVSVLWVDSTRAFNFSFFPIISAVLGEIVLYSELKSSSGFIVLPGSRSNLVHYKLQHDPRLSRAFRPVQGSWRFLKFRHLKALAENPMLSPDNLDQLLRLDPLTYTTPQMQMI